MSGISNTNLIRGVPSFPKERQTRNVVKLSIIQNSAMDSSILYVKDTSLVKVGMYVSGNNVSNPLNGVSGFSKTFTTVIAKSQNSIILSTPVLNDCITGDLYSFDSSIRYRDSIYNSTVLVDNINKNALYNIPAKAISHTGWNKVTIGTGGRAGRVQVETLAALSTPTYTNPTPIVSPNTTNTYISTGSQLITDQSGRLFDLSYSTKTRIANVKYGANMSLTFSALNPNADGSGLTRVYTIYETMIIPGMTRDSPIVTNTIPLGQSHYIIDIEHSYRPAEDAWYYQNAIQQVRARVGAGPKISLFSGFPSLDVTMATTQSLRDAYRGISISGSGTGDLVDVYTPGIYMDSPTTTIDQWKQFAKKVVAACWENNPNKPVMPYMWHSYISNQQQIDTVTWQEMIRYMRTLLDRADEGIIFWSGSWETTYLPRMVGL